MTKPMRVVMIGQAPTHKNKYGILTFQIRDMVEGTDEAVIREMVKQEVQNSVIHSFFKIAGLQRVAAINLVGTDLSYTLHELTSYNAAAKETYDKAYAYRQYLDAPLSVILSELEEIAQREMVTIFAHEQRRTAKAVLLKISLRRGQALNHLETWFPLRCVQQVLTSYWKVNAAMLVEKLSGMTIPDSVDTYSAEMLLARHRGQTEAPLDQPYYSHLQDKLDNIAQRNLK